MDHTHKRSHRLSKSYHRKFLQHRSKNGKAVQQSPSAFFTSVLLVRIKEKKLKLNKKAKEKICSNKMGYASTAKCFIEIVLSQRVFRFCDFLLLSTRNCHNRQISIDEIVLTDFMRRVFQFFFITCAVLLPLFGHFLCTHFVFAAVYEEGGGEHMCVILVNIFHSTAIHH